MDNTDRFFVSVKNDLCYLQNLFQPELLGSDLGEELDIMRSILTSHVITKRPQNWPHYVWTSSRQVLFYKPLGIPWHVTWFWSFLLEFLSVTTHNLIPKLPQPCTDLFLLFRCTTGWTYTGPCLKRVRLLWAPKCNKQNFFFQKVMLLIHVNV